VWNKRVHVRDDGRDNAGGSVRGTSNCHRHLLALQSPSVSNLIEARA
jgi:hypothetical protein